MNIAMDVTVVIFAGALFIYALYLNIVLPRRAKKVVNSQEKNK